MGLLQAVRWEWEDVVIAHDVFSLLFVPFCEGAFALLLQLQLQLRLLLLSNHIDTIHDAHSATYVAATSGAATQSQGRP